MKPNFAAPPLSLENHGVNCLKNVTEATVYPLGPGED